MWLWYLSQQTTTNFFFFLQNFMDRKSILTLNLSNLSIQVFPFLYCQEFSSFHLKEALYGFSLAYVNRKHHYSCTLEPLLSKMRMNWTQTLQCHNSWFHNWDGYEVTTGKGHLQCGDTKQSDIHVTWWDGVEGERFYHVTQNAWLFETYVLFLEISI